VLCVARTGNTRDYINALRTARRPKPPSLKEQALQAAQRFYANGHEDCNDEEVKDDFDIIRRALESLPD
jgi:DNA-directed RNA polymerase specialized sigma24 family protein